MPRKVLYIDDDEGLCALVKRGLGREGIDVVSAGDGESGLATLAAQEFDVVSVDLYMPGLSGIETLERINAAIVSVYPDPYSPAIALSWYRPAGSDREHPTVIAVLDPAGAVRVVHTAIDMRSYATLLAVRAGRLIWAAPATMGAVYQVRSLPLAGLPDPLPAPPAIYTSDPMPSARIFPDASRRLGAGLLAYVTSAGELHVRAYDGATDLLLESGVRALYSADPPEESYFLQ